MKGRKSTISDETKAKIKEMYRKGLNPREIADKLNLKESTVKNYCYDSNIIFNDKKKQERAMKRFRVGIKKDRYLENNLIRIKKATDIFNSILSGNKVKLSYRHNNKVKTDDLLFQQSDRYLEIHNGIVIQKTQDVIHIVDEDKPYKRAGINMAQILTGEVSVILC